MNKKIILSIIVIGAAAGAYFYYKKNSTSSMVATYPEDNVFTQKLWAEFSKRAHDSPPWIMEQAIDLYQGNHPDADLYDSFYRINGKMLKAGALFGIIQRGYVGTETNLFGSKSQQWQELWDLYTNWHYQMIMKYAQ